MDHCISQNHKIDPYVNGKEPYGKKKIHLLTTSRNNNQAQRILIIYITRKTYFSHDTGKKFMQKTLKDYSGKLKEN